MQACLVLRYIIVRSGYHFVSYISEILIKVLCVCTNLKDSNHAIHNWFCTEGITFSHFNVMFIGLLQQGKCFCTYIFHSSVIIVTTKHKPLQSCCNCSPNFSITRVHLQAYGNFMVKTLKHYLVFCRYLQSVTKTKMV